MAKVITATEAAELFKDGDVVALACFGMAGLAEEIVLALRDRYVGDIRNIFPRQRILKNWCKQFYSVLLLNEIDSYRSIVGYMW